MKSNAIVEDLPTFAELQEIMDEYCGTIPWVGSLPTTEETAHLAEETDESEDEGEDRPTKRATRRVGSRN
jgi:hypothetical protein